MHLIQFKTNILCTFLHFRGDVPSPHHLELECEMEHLIPFRRSSSIFFFPQVRRALGDFGVPISIVCMVLTDYFIQDTYTEKLTMPPGIQPSNTEVRGWFINPFGVTKSLPVWCMFMAAPASLLLFFLVFLEENICQ